MTDVAALGQLARYGLIGLLSNAALYLAYLALTGAGMGPKVAMTLLYALGVAQTFIFNKRWSFRHGGANRPAFVRYCIVYALGYLFNFLALIAFVDHLGYPHQIVQGVLVLLLALILFLLQKFWVFRSDISMSTVSGPSQ